MGDYFDVHVIWHVELCRWYESCQETECHESAVGELIGNYELRRHDIEKLCRDQLSAVSRSRHNFSMSCLGSHSCQSTLQQGLHYTLSPLQL